LPVSCLALQRQGGKDRKVANQRQTRGEAGDDLADLRNDGEGKAGNKRNNAVEHSGISEVLLDALNGSDTALQDVFDDVFGIVDDEVAQALRGDLREVDRHGFEGTFNDLVTAGVGENVLGGGIEDGKGDDVVGLDVGPDDVDNAAGRVDDIIATEETVDGVQDGESGSRRGGGSDESKRETHVDGICRV
jgi:hypothetical protein